MSLKIEDKVYLGKAVPGSGGSAPVIDELNVTPSTSAQVITAPEGTDGYSPVNVSAVTSAIDANIVAGNIKKDVQILGVTGSYEGVAPSGTKSITINGTHDVAGYANADVQVPTTAPTYYIEKSVDANGKLISGGSSIIELTGVSDVGTGSLAYAYYSNTNLTGNIDISGIKKISGTNGMYYAFCNCSNISSINFSVEEISGTYGMQNCFRGCTGLTGTVDISSLKIINADYACAGLFYGCTGITSAKIGNFLETTGNYTFNGAFRDCTSLTSVDVSKITNITQGGFDQCFFNCTGLNYKKIWFSSLVDLNGGTYQYSCFNNCFYGHRSVKVYMPALKNITNNCCQQMFNNAAACELHIPSNINNITSSGATVYRDLPSTVPLNGADSNIYDRNPIYDTETALGWRIGTAWTTPYYTSGTTSPAVGDTIYSDAACTVAVTTIDTIA